MPIVMYFIYITMGAKSPESRKSAPCPDHFAHASENRHTAKGLTKLYDLSNGAL